MAQIAGAAVSSPAISTVLALPGAHSMPTAGLSPSARGPTMATSSPTMAARTQREAGPASPWVTKSMSTSRRSGRAWRTV
jgi:hypothetical protein